jgi:phospholipid/cholesterol/gamma-HCH transport system substrate-binding protein
VIKNVPSLYARLDQAISTLLSDPSLPRLAANLNQLTVNAEALTDRENRDALRQLLAETAKVTRTLERMTGRVDAQLPVMLEQTRESIRALREMSNEAAQTGVMVERLVDQNRAGIAAFTGQTLAESGLLVTEVRQLTATLTRLASQLEREPNALLFGKTPLPRGPGE